MNLITDVFGVFTEVGDWLVEALLNVLNLFYVTTPAEGQTAGLTVIGILALCALGISIIMMVINRVSDFFTFRS